MKKQRGCGGPARSTSHGLPQERFRGNPMSGGPGWSRVVAAANMEKAKVSPEKHRHYLGRDDIEWGFAHRAFFLGEESLYSTAGWRDGSEVERADCSSRGPRFSSQHQRSSSQLSAAPVPGDPTPSH